MDANDLSALISLSRSILSELELLTSTTKAAALVKFQKDFLVTDQQRRIYEAIDGERDYQAIADSTSASLRSVQLLAKSLIENDLVISEKRGRSTILSKATAKIATYYAKQELQNAEVTPDE